MRTMFLSSALVGGNGLHGVACCHGIMLSAMVLEKRRGKLNSDSKSFSHITTDYYNIIICTAKKRTSANTKYFEGAVTLYITVRTSENLRTEVFPGSLKGRDFCSFCVTTLPIFSPTTIQ